MVMRTIAPRSEDVIAPPALVVESVSVERRGTPILRDVSFSTPLDGAVAITGPSGSGKTTLLGVIGGAVQHTGRVTVDLDGRPRPVPPDDVAWIFQSPRAVSRHRAWEVVATPDLVTGMATDDARIRAVMMLDRLGLAAYADRRYGRLSGGERQRVLIARAALEDRPLVVADEPSAALDRDSAHLVGALLADLARSRLVLIASHDATLWEYCRRTVRLDAGAVA